MSKIVGVHVACAGQEPENPVTFVMADGTYRKPTDPELRDYLLRHPWDSANFQPERVRALLGDDDGELFGLVSDAHWAGREPGIDGAFDNDAFRGAQEPAAKRILRYDAVTDAGIAEQLQILVRALYSMKNLDADQIAVIHRAVAWLTLGTSERGMEVRRRDWSGSSSLTNAPILELEKRLEAITYGYRLSPTFKVAIGEYVRLHQAMRLIDRAANIGGSRECTKLADNVCDAVYSTSERLKSDLASTAGDLVTLLTLVARERECNGDEEADELLRSLQVGLEALRALNDRKPSLLPSDIQPELAAFNDLQCAYDEDVVPAMAAE